MGLIIFLPRALVGVPSSCPRSSHITPFLLPQLQWAGTKNWGLGFEAYCHMESNFGS